MTYNFEQFARHFFFRKKRNHRTFHGDFGLTSTSLIHIILAGSETLLSRDVHPKNTATQHNITKQKSVQIGTTVQYKGNMRKEKMENRCYNFEKTYSKFFYMHTKGYKN